MSAWNWNVIFYHFCYLMQTLTGLRRNIVTNIVYEPHGATYDSKNTTRSNNKVIEFYLNNGRVLATDKLHITIILYVIIVATTRTA